jgi:hypothetical protein
VVGVASGATVTGEEGVDGAAAGSPPPHAVRRTAVASRTSDRFR